MRGWQAMRAPFRRSEETGASERRRPLAHATEPRELLGALSRFGAPRQGGDFATASLLAHSPVFAW